MIYKLEQAQRQMDKYHGAVSTYSPPLDTSVNISEKVISISLVTGLCAVIILNIILYLVYKRLTRHKSNDAKIKSASTLSGSEKLDESMASQTTVSVPSPCRRLGMVECTVGQHTKPDIRSSSVNDLTSLESEIYLNYIP